MEAKAQLIGVDEVTFRDGTVRTVVDAKLTDGSIVRFWPTNDGTEAAKAAAKLPMGTAVVLLLDVVGKDGKPALRFNGIKQAA